MTLESLLTLIIIGAIAGILADALVGGVRLGFLGATIIGIIGAFLGNWLFTQLHIRIAANPFLVSIITAFVGSVILLFLFRGIRRA
jgi:uncharacterized membrane protein YeaQ/YmgE (transglycosylase-associated protein family)